MLGETLTGVVTGLADEPLSALSLSVGLVAVVVGFGAWWTYFDFAGHRHPRPNRAASGQWMLSHLPLTAAIAATGAAMVSLIDHTHDGRTPAATAWMLSAGAAVVLCATMLVSASLQARQHDRHFYQPVARACAAVAVACLGVERPGPRHSFLASFSSRCSASRGESPSRAAWLSRPTRSATNPVVRMSKPCATRLSPDSWAGEHLEQRLAVGPRSSHGDVRVGGGCLGTLDACGCVGVLLVESLVFE